MTRSSAGHNWICIQWMNNIRDGTWLHQSLSNFPCAVCLLLIMFLVHSFAVAGHKWYQPSQDKSNGIPQTKRRNRFFLLGPSEHSQCSAHLGPWTFTYCLLSKLAPPKPENYHGWLVTEKQHFPSVVAIDIHICRRDMGQIPPQSPKDTHLLKRG